MPTQVVLVPMLLLLPTPTVPLLVALALVLTTLIDALRGRVATRARAALASADAWFALAPALVLVARRRADAGLERLAGLLAALAAQIALDTRRRGARVGCLGESPRDVLGELRDGHRVDLLLSPVGLLAAFAAAEQPYAVLLVRPARRPVHDLRRASAPRASSRRSSCPAPTAAPRCCSAT